MVKNQAPIHPSITINRKTVAKEVRGDIGLVIDKFEKQDDINENEYEQYLLLELQRIQIKHD